MNMYVRMPHAVTAVTELANHNHSGDGTTLAVHCTTLACTARLAGAVHGMARICH